MQHRRKLFLLMYGFLGIILFVSFVYSPVLYLWGTRNERMIDSPYERDYVGYDREVWIDHGWVLTHIPGYHQMLLFHAGMNGWFLDDFLTEPILYHFVPDTPLAREKIRKKKEDYPPIFTDPPVKP